MSPYFPRIEDPKEKFSSTAVAATQHHKLRNFCFNQIKSDVLELLFDPRMRVTEKQSGLNNEYISVALFKGLQCKLEKELFISHRDAVKRAHFTEIADYELVLLEFSEPDEYESKYVILAKNSTGLKYYTVDRLKDRFAFYEWDKNGEYRLIFFRAVPDKKEVVTMLKLQLLDFEDLLKDPDCIMHVEICEDIGDDS